VVADGALLANFELGRQIAQTSKGRRAPVIPVYST
jgi:hypothetical protein